jgi:hypothetical protein
MSSSSNCFSNLRVCTCNNVENLIIIHNVHRHLDWFFSLWITAQMIKMCGAFFYLCLFFSQKHNYAESGRCQLWNRNRNLNSTIVEEWKSFGWPFLLDFICLKAIVNKSRRENLVHSSDTKKATNTKKTRQLKAEIRTLIYWTTKLNSYQLKIGGNFYAVSAQIFVDVVD